MKKVYLVISILALVLLGTWVYQGSHVKEAKESDEQVAYVQASSSSESVSSDAKTQAEVDAEENIDAEQIVVSITDQGYATSHGDHYHFYNGKVPYDALFSEELLLNDPNLVLEDNQIVSSVKGGHIVKVEDQYYFSLEENADRSNLRQVNDSSE